MIEHLQLINFSSQSTIPPQWDGEEFNLFKLKTCQRKLFLALRPLKTDLLQSLDRPLSETPQDFDYREGESAYAYLLEVLCGLRSEIVGETEIVAQFKEAYLGYITSPARQKEMIVILEKLLKDAKEIRTKYLIGLCQQTYAAIGRKVLLEYMHHSTQENPPVLIIGTGQLAINLILQLKKKFQLSLTARNQQKLEKLGEEHGISIIPWGQNPSDYLFFKNILCAIGPEKALFNHAILEKWHHHHEGSGVFIDFGNPSAIETTFGLNENIFRLKNIFEQAQSGHKEFQQKVLSAQEAVRTLSQKRSVIFSRRQLTLR